MDILLVIFLILSCIQPVINKDDSDENGCFKVGNYYWKHLASKTPYRYVANRNDTEFHYDKCSPKKLWAIIRHGTRYPGAKFINKMRSRLIEIQESINDNFESKRGTLCLQSVANITSWSPHMEIANGKRLAHEGEDEMIELAERFQNRFPSILGTEYTNSSFQFKSTATQRTIQSKYYFLVGLFGRRVAHHVWSPEPVYKDPLLRFYKLCTKWLKEVQKSAKSLNEIEILKSVDATNEVVRNVSFRLGFDKQLSFEDVEIMYTTCSFESAINRGNPSPWCFVFTKKEMELMEFFRDLKHYWIDGYGFDINFKQACPLLKNMFDFLRSEKGPTSSFYFTHSGTLLKLLSHLGLYYDEQKLTHQSLNRPRLWKVGRIDAFASNLAFVSYQCGNEEKILVLHQERPIRLPGCPKEGLCSFQKIMKTFKESFMNCQFDEMCSTGIEKN